MAAADHSSCPIVSLRHAHEHRFVQQFGRACTDARQRQQRPQQQVAAEAGLAKSALSLLEDGKLPKLPLYTAWRVAQALELPLDVLCGAPCAPPLDLSAYYLRLLLHAYAGLNPAAQELLVSTALDLDRVQRQGEPQYRG
jgi:transcriptional regulator with XRE-family HTH domain